MAAETLTPEPEPDAPTHDELHELIHDEPGEDDPAVDRTEDPE